MGGKKHKGTVDVEKKKKLKKQRKRNHINRPTTDKGFPGGACSKEPACQCKPERQGFDRWVWEDLLEEGMATHSSILAWRILWTEKPGGLQSIGSQRVRED